MSGGGKSISIHALREEGDRPPRKWLQMPRNFYPRPPRGGRREYFYDKSGAPYFYPRPPRGGRPRVPSGQTPVGNFYPRPPRGGRRRNAVGRQYNGGFLSTPSARRATAQMQEVPVFQQISIHALREEGDCMRRGRLRCRMRFLSTPSARRATSFPLQKPDAFTISIHALREEGDMLRLTTLEKHIDFYPRPPRGGRRGTPAAALMGAYFYPRPPRGGRQAAPEIKKIYSEFLSTPSARRATARSFRL